MAINFEGSLTGPTGEIRHFSRQAFVKLASDLSRCFICGVSEADCQFNNEHVIPDWLLRRFDLHSRRITLPNGRQLMYGRYTVRCCQSCNELLGRTIETPISRLFLGDIRSVEKNLQAISLTHLYQWLCLLFIKLLLKDREIRADPDTRNQSVNVSEFYDWDGLHHIHSVARATRSGAKIDSSVPGTTFFFEMAPKHGEFDLNSLTDYSTILVRIGSVGIVSVLNDCGFVGPMVSEFLSGISGPMSAIQLREVAARLAYGNKLLTNRPNFWSELERDEILAIRSRPPVPGELGEIDSAELGHLIAFSCGPLLMNSHTPEPEEKIRQLQRGEIQFIYHDDGSFIRDDE